MQMLLRDEDEAWDLIIGFGNVEGIDLNKSEYVKWWRQKLFGVGSKKTGGEIVETVNIYSSQRALL